MASISGWPTRVTSFCRSTTAAASATADTTLNIVPHGNEAPGVPWASTPGILQLPVTALLFRQHGMKVATVGPDGRVVLKNIQIGRDMGTRVEVVAGLTVDERAVRVPLHVRIERGRLVDEIDCEAILARCPTESMRFAATGL